MHIPHSTSIHCEICIRYESNNATKKASAGRCIELPRNLRKTQSTHDQLILQNPQTNAVSLRLHRGFASTAQYPQYDTSDVVVQPLFVTTTYTITALT